ncbi:glycoside hydrolase family 2 protein [Ascidiimonas aurantiaca]|uniref:glycoside hydrolase family 2 protein n=1 Tax=Ascidiimonas aurantiaca TaxID=1685432 RepID=UPI0030EC4459
MNRHTLSLFLFLITPFLWAQQPVAGGLQADKTLIITPEGIVNENPLTSKKLGYKLLDDPNFDYEIAPRLPEDIHWIAGFNLPFKEGATTNLFFYDSWVGTSKNIRTNARKRKFPNDITRLVKSNAYHIAIQREFMVENETYMLVISPKKQKVIIELPESIFKTNRVLTYDMDAWEAKFIHIVIPPEEHTVVMWDEENTRSTLPLKENWQFVYRKKREPGDVTDWFANNPFKKGKETIQTVSVPHVFEYYSHFDNRNFKDTLDITEMYARGTGWYRIEFPADASWKEKYVKLDFLGANTRTDVWLNGVYLRKHENGYTGFHHGIVEHLRYDQPNELIVRVDNRYHKEYLPHTADYNAQGGLYREVRVQAQHKSFVKDVFITTPKVSPVNADVQVALTLRNMSWKNARYRVRTNLVNPYNEIIASSIQSITLPATSKTFSLQKEFNNIKNPMLWGPDHPHLYKVVVSLTDEQGVTIDQTSDHFGMRFFHFDKDEGFFLNGEPLKLHGVNVHQDNYRQGWAIDSISRKKDYLLMKAMGVNFIRMAHYPHHPHALHLADSLGMMVWEEIPVVNSVGEAAFIKNVEKTTRAMVLRDRNHPSVIMWGVGNEYYREYLTDEVIDWSLKSTKAAIEVVKEFDTTRPTVMAQNDLKDDKAMSLVDLQGRNKYIGWYTGGSAYRGLTQPEEIVQSLQYDREEHPEWKIIVSEYGAEGKYGYHVNDPQRFDHSETYQLHFHKTYWQFIKKTRWIAGSTLWNMFDFVSFAKVGNIPHINQKGVMTYHRKPKSLYYYYQSQWTEKPMVYINSHTHLHRTGNPSQKQTIEVFSNCDTVTLYVNNTKAGTLSQQEEWIWQVPLKLGFNFLKAVGTKDGQTVVTTLKIHFSNEVAVEKKVQGNDSD